MCGIAGYVDFSGKQCDEQIVEQMLKKLAHRGPDDTRCWVNKNVALGAGRLSILDLSDYGNQPFIAKDGKGVLAYNGEVYNYRELRNELKNEGINFISSCDTEVILNALHQWGPEKAVRKFNGMFAFAYYDLRTQTLWFGRDQAGIKPFYYLHSKGILAFASEIKALFEHPSLTCRPDMHAITTYILKQRLDRWTPFENVRELLPGTLLKISGETKEEIIFFDLLRDLDVDRILNAESHDYTHLQEKLDGLIRQSVQSQLVSDVPVAIMCSGGVDSSLLTVYAHQFQPDIVAYVADVEGFNSVETERARKVTDSLGIELREVPISREYFMKLWPKAIYYNDEPFYFKQTALHMAVANAAHKDGFKVLLCGEGADELFGGYSWQAKDYQRWRKRRRVYELLSTLKPLHLFFKKILKVYPLVKIDFRDKDPFKKIVQEYPTQFEPRELLAIDNGIRNIRQRSLFQKLNPLQKVEDRAFLARSFEDFYVHLGTSLKCNDKMNMACSVESRVPFLDSKLIDFAIHLPRSTKYHKGTSKYLLKKVASTYLPDEIVHAKKIGFGISDHIWKGNTDRLLRDGWVEQMLKWNRSTRKDLLKQIRQNSFLEYHLMSLEIWGRIYFNSEKPEKLSEKLMGQ